MNPIHYDKDNPESLIRFLVDANIKLIQSENEEDYELAKEIRDNIIQWLKIQANHLHGKKRYPDREESNKAYDHIYQSLLDENKYVVDRLREQRDNF